MQKSRKVLYSALCAIMIASALSSCGGTDEKTYAEVARLIKDPASSSTLGDKAFSIYIYVGGGYYEHEGVEYQPGYIARGAYAFDFTRAAGVAELASDTYYKVSAKINGVNNFDDGTGDWLCLLITEAQLYVPLSVTDDYSEAITVGFDSGKVTYKFTGAFYDASDGSVHVTMSMTNSHKQALAPQTDYLNFYYGDDYIYNIVEDTVSAKTEPGETRVYNVVLYGEEEGYHDLLEVELYKDNFSLDAVVKIDVTK